MGEASAPAMPHDDLEAKARLHGVLRFGAGTSAAFVLCETMGWYPTFLGSLYAGMLLSNLPKALPAKVGLVLIAIMGIGAWAAFTLASLLRGVPIVLFGIVGLIVFILFASIVAGRSFLPIILILIAFATIPVVALAVPQAAEALPVAFTRSMAVAVVAVWVVHVVWPATAKAGPPAPMGPFTSPLALAVAGTAIVVPMMLVYLMYGLTDALAMLITTVIIVINFDPRRGAITGAVRMIGTLIGGVVAIAAFAVLQIAPNLVTLGLIAFLIGVVFAEQIARGGTSGAIGVLTYNQTMVMFGLALMPGGASPGMWMTRMLQFGLAVLFAVGMMTLLIPRNREN